MTSWQQKEGTTADSVLSPPLTWREEVADDHDVGMNHFRLILTRNTVTGLGFNKLTWFNTRGASSLRLFSCSLHLPSSFHPDLLTGYRLPPFWARYFSQQLNDGHESGNDKYSLPKARKRISERGRAMANRTKEMSEITRIRLRETRAAVKDKIGEMRENIFTYPNGLSLLRILITPIMGYCILEHHHATALGLFLAAGVTDLLDGYIARTFPSQKSVLGSVLDPVADKFLVASSFLTLTMDNLIPLPLTIVIISRDAILVFWGGYIRYLSVSHPKSMAKFFDFSVPTAEVKPTLMSKLNTVLQLSLIFSTLASPVFPHWVHHDLLQTLWWTTAATTLLSGAGYLSMKGSYRVVKKGQTK